MLLGSLGQRFQSTPSGGKATGRSCFLGAWDNGFNPRLPGGRRPACKHQAPQWVLFQSTPSGGKATRCRLHRTRRLRVSIHAFRGEGDVVTPPSVRHPRCFNPRLPGGRRQAGSAPGSPLGFSFNPRLPGGRRHEDDDLDWVPRSFNPRLPGGRRRSTPARCPKHTGVSIHAFRGEGDRAGHTLWFLVCGFNPRLPGGRRRAPRSERLVVTGFQSTPSGGKATTSTGVTGHNYKRFNPRLPGGRRRDADFFIRACEPFQSTPSGGKATINAHSETSSARVSIHAFRGEGDRRNQRHRLDSFLVSIHAFRGEGD